MNVKVKGFVGVNLDGRVNTHVTYFHVFKQTSAGRFALDRDGKWVKVTGGIIPNACVFTGSDPEVMEVEVRR